MGVTLINNVDGSWESSRDNLKQDLANLQRAVNRLMRTPATVAKSNTTAIIAPSGAVTTPRTTNLTVVSTKIPGALDGNGIPTNPLAVRTDSLSTAINSSNQLIGRVFRVIKTVTDAQIKSLNTSPVTLVAAPGAGKIIFPIQAILHRHFAATYSASVTWSVRWASIAFDIMALGGLTNTITPTDAYSTGMASTVGESSVSSGGSNAALVLRTSADVTNGNAANFVQVSLLYHILDTSEMDTV